MSTRAGADAGVVVDAVADAVFMEKKERRDFGIWICEDAELPEKQEARGRVPRALEKRMRVVARLAGQAFSTRPALIAFTETRTRLVPPLAVLIRIRWRFGRNLRGVMVVTCVPMPPLFLD